MEESLVAEQIHNPIHVWRKEGRQRMKKSFVEGSISSSKGNSNLPWPDPEKERKRAAQPLPRHLTSNEPLQMLQMNKDKKERDEAEKLQRKCFAKRRKRGAKRPEKQKKNNSKKVWKWQKCIGIYADEDDQVTWIACDLLCLTWLYLDCKLLNGTAYHWKKMSPYLAIVFNYS